MEYEAGHWSGFNGVSRWMALGRRAANTERMRLPSGVSDPCGMHELLAAGSNAARKFSRMDGRRDILCSWTTFGLVEVRARLWRALIGRGAEP